uniref:Uncharacterized protein n=1 Tax=Aegilops tauschii subsp. strangulata TaxID=200361 RepID=A0A453QSS5_AEGTS
GSPAGREGTSPTPRRRRRRRGEEEEMKLKQLEGLLGGLTQFSDPKVELEQYATGPHIASRMLYTVAPRPDSHMPCCLYAWMRSWYLL